MKKYTSFLNAIIYTIFTCCLIVLMSSFTFYGFFKFSKLSLQEMNKIYYYKSKLE